MTPPVFGRSGASPLAQYLPTIYRQPGTAIWVFRRPYITDDGVTISAAADLSLGLSPLSQGTAARQPGVDLVGGRATFLAATVQYLACSAAGLVAFPDNRGAASLSHVSEMHNLTPGAQMCVGGWTNTGAFSTYLLGFHTVGDNLRTQRAAGGSTVTATGAAAVTETKATYIHQDTGGATDSTLTNYRENTADGTGTGAMGATTNNMFAIGAWVGSSAIQPWTGSMHGAIAMNRVPTATERAQITAWGAAGCPA